MSETKSIIVERVIPHPIEKIWRALTEAPLIAEWLMRNDFKAEEGHRFTFHAKPVPGWSGLTNCVVLTVDRPYRLVYSWGDGTESESGLRTVVTWTLVPEGAGTRVRMEQSGFRPEDERGYIGMGSGWPRILERLEEVAGRAIPCHCGDHSFQLKIIGRVESALGDPQLAPRQADEGAPEASLVFEPEMEEALGGLCSGERAILLTWLDRARRDVLSVHPREDERRPRLGVFSTRTPHRPNPIGLHTVEIIAMDGLRVRVRHLEAIDGTPIIDVKPLLNEDPGQR